jgi:hypothetical protein
MISAADLLRLPFDDSLAWAGVEYAKKSLHYTYDRMNLQPGARLRKIVAGVAVELAFRRWLDASEVPYDLLGATAFTEKDKYDLRLGGRRCDLKSFLLSKRDDITALRRDPAWLLDAAALVPEDQLLAHSLDDGDIYVFGFLAGLEARQREDVEKAAQAGRRLELVVTPEREAWLGREKWHSLGKLALKTDLAAPLEVEVGGQDADRGALVEHLTLPPRTRVETEHEYHSLLYLRVTRLPEGPVGVRSPVLQDTLLAAPTDWHNIWVYGMDVFITGWMTKGDFRSHARRLPAGSAVKQYHRTQTNNYALHCQHLHPVRALAERVKAFAKAMRGGQ